MAKEDRKGRRINYSRKELAEYLHCAETSVDYRLKKISDYYDKLDSSSFKKEIDNNRNFFPPEYAPLLKILLKEYDGNPAVKKAKDQSAEAIQDFNKRVLLDIADSEDIPDYLKEVMETLPWIRVSKILSESLDELVDELTVFIFELVSANGNDIGETVKYIIRELDTMNYNLFRGSCLNMLDTGLIRNNYLNRRDIAIDVGIVTLIKLLMEYIGLEEIQNSNVQELKEYFSEEKRSDFENRLRKEGIEESKITQGADKLERSEYLSSQKDSILYMLNKNSVSNAMEAVIISGRKWESIVERIKNDTFDITEEIGKYYESHKISGVDKDTWVGVHKMPESIENYVTSNYVDHYENILREKKQLREKVDSMIGQILVELFSKVQR
ncbi:hypothetical protein [Agathobacter rectalis]|nr:hypothetical protein [Agathobacter rectalis]